MTALLCERHRQADISIAMAWLISQISRYRPAKRHASATSGLAHLNTSVEPHGGAERAHYLEGLAIHHELLHEISRFDAYYGALDFEHSRHIDNRLLMMLFAFFARGRYC